MSLTLRGRLELRLAASLVPLLAACALAAALETWWPVKLAALMIGAGLGLDLTLYHRFLPYQPGWVALPLGVLEFLVVIALVKLTGIEAPFLASAGLFWGSWLLAQALSHAVFPSLRLSYAEDGGELGRAGPPIAAAVLVAFGAVGGVAWATMPPTIYLEEGVHRGPLVLDRAQNLVGQPGTVIDGGIVVTADDVTIRDVHIVGGTNGIEVDGAERVVIKNVEISRARLDGINVRRGQVEIHDCLIHSLASPYAQGIDISFSFDLAASVVEGCTVNGGQEGIVTHSAHVEVLGNHVSDTTMRGIAVTEMSHGSVDDNHVQDALGVGIFCGDYSACEIAENRVLRTRADGASGDGFRAGHPIVAHFGAEAFLDGNLLESNAAGVAEQAGGRLHGPDAAD